MMPSFFIPKLQALFCVFGFLVEIRENKLRQEYNEFMLQWNVISLPESCATRFSFQRNLIQIQTWTTNERSQAILQKQFVCVYNFEFTKGNDFNVNFPSD